MKKECSSVAGRGDRIVGEVALVRAFAILFFDGFKLFLSLAIMVLLLCWSRFLEE